jgi:hypothetical protein
VVAPAALAAETLLRRGVPPASKIHQLSDASPTRPTARSGRDPPRACTARLPGYLKSE